MNYTLHNFNVWQENLHFFCDFVQKSMVIFAKSWAAYKYIQVTGNLVYHPEIYTHSSLKNYRPLEAQNFFTSGFVGVVLHHKLPSSDTHLLRWCKTILGGCLICSTLPPPLTPSGPPPSSSLCSLPVSAPRGAELSVVLLQLWNLLSPDTRNNDSIPLFNSTLRTHLFETVWQGMFVNFNFI